MCDACLSCYSLNLCCPVDIDEQYNTVENVEMEISAIYETVPV